MTTLLVSGIVNPFGPTMEVLFAEGDVEDNFDIYYLLLNPFKQAFLKVGDGTGIKLADEPGNYIEAECLTPFFENLGSCPTVVLDVPAFIPDPEWRAPYFRDFLKGRPGAAFVLKSVKKHPFDPWKRVEAEMARLNPTDPTMPVKSPPLSDGDADELRTLLLDPRHIEPELKAFVFAWNGSIAFQRENGSKSQASGAMDVDRFLTFFSRIEKASNRSLIWLSFVKQAIGLLSESFHFPVCLTANCSESETGTQ